MERPINQMGHTISASRCKTVLRLCTEKKIAGLSLVAAGISIPLPKVRLYLSELVANGKIMMCRSILFEKGKKIERIICRIAGYIPPATPGRKAKAQLNSA